MDGPVDPVLDSRSPVQILADIPTDAAFNRALEAADVETTPYSKRPREELIDELTDAETQKAAGQVRFAGSPSVFYYDLPRLDQIDSEVATNVNFDPDSSNISGPVLTSGEILQNQVYLICSLHEDGNQSQLVFTPESRVTTVATYKPRTDLLAVRAPNRATADVTSHLVENHLDLEGTKGISLSEPEFRTRLEDHCLRHYDLLIMEGTNHGSHVNRIEISAAGSDARADLRHDEIVNDLTNRNDTNLDRAEGILSVYQTPRVRFDFSKECIDFQQFVSERTLLQVDNAIRSTL